MYNVGSLLMALTRVIFRPDQPSRADRGRQLRGRLRGSDVGVHMGADQIERMHAGVLQVLYEIVQEILQRRV